MVGNIRYSDLITLLRIFLVGIFALIVSLNPSFFGLYFGLFLILFIFSTDAIDGIVARNFDEEKKSGAFFDITGDRITEIVLLIPFTYLSIAHPVIITYFVTKGFLVDHKRYLRFMKSKKTPFAQVSKSYKKLVSSKYMRGFYGFVKMLMFLLFYILIFKSNPQLKLFSELVWAVTIITSLLRAFPVFVTK